MAEDLQHSDLFSDPVMKQQFESLPTEEKAAYKRAGEYMYAKDYAGTTSAVDDAIAYISAAFKSGMMPSQLTSDELEFLRSVYGSEWYKEFDFPSETYSGIQKKRPSPLRKRPEPMKMPAISRLRVIDEESPRDFSEEYEENDPEEDEINRQSSHVYTVWS